MKTWRFFLGEGFRSGAQIVNRTLCWPWSCLRFSVERRWHQAGLRTRKRGSTPGSFLGMSTVFDVFMVVFGSGAGPKMQRGTEHHAISGRPLKAGNTKNRDLHCVREGFGDSNQGSNPSVGHSVGHVDFVAAICVNTLGTPNFCRTWSLSQANCLLRVLRPDLMRVLCRA